MLPVMLDLSIILAFVAYAVTAGFRARKKASQNLTEYFLAGRTLSGWRAGLSMAATQFAADTPLLVTGLIATGGVFLLWRLWIYGLAFLLMAFVLATKWRRSGVLTDAELTEIRYSGKGVLLLRVLKAIYYGTVINCAVMAMVLVAAMRIAEVFLPWHLWLPAGGYDAIAQMVNWTGLHLGDTATGLPELVHTTNNLISIVVILAFTALYSMTGGLRSVVATDVLQFSLAMIGTAAYAVIVVSEIGGLGQLTERITALYGVVRAGDMLAFSPGWSDALLPFLVIIGLQWFYQMNADGTGYLAQRSMACSSDREARFAGVVFTWMQILVRSLIWLVIGVGLLVVYPFDPVELGSEQFAAGREILFVTGINDLLPAGLRGLMLVGLLAALASTIDTHLNWGASYWSNDIYRRLICHTWLKRQPRDLELVLAARLSNLLILVIAIAIMASLASIQTAWFISLLFGAGMGAVLVLRWLWERINLYSELAAIATSLVVAPILLVATQQEWLRLGLMALLSTVATVVATVVTPRTDNETLVAFYRKVRPSGFWVATAALADDLPTAPLTRLKTQVILVGICAASLFCLLIGLGKLLVPAPGESWVGPLLLVVVGVALIPVWWRRAFR